MLLNKSFALTILAIAMSSTSGCSLKNILPSSIVNHNNEQGNYKKETQQQKPFGVDESDLMSPAYVRTYIDEDGQLEVKDEVANSSLETDESFLIDTQIKSLSVKGLTLFNVLTLVAPEISITSKDDVKNIPIYVNGYTGNLKGLLDTIQKTSGVFYSINDKKLILMKNKKFFIKIPPNFYDGIGKLLIENFEKFGAKNVFYNPAYQTVSYESDYESSKIIEKFLKDVAMKVSTISYDTWIWEVDITKRNGVPINFGVIGSNPGSVMNPYSSLNTTDAQKASILSLGNGKTVHLKSIFNYLESIGKLKQIASPTLTMLSGSESGFRVGKDSTYVSKASKSDGLIETSKVATGVDLNIEASFYKDTVFSKFNVKVVDELESNKIDISGMKFNLPNTFQRTFEADARIKVGDYYLMSGIVYKRSDSEGRENNNKDYEMVVLMRPRVTLFSKDFPKRKDPIKVDLVLDNSNSSDTQDPLKSSGVENVDADIQPDSTSTDSKDKGVDIIQMDDANIDVLVNDFDSSENKDKVIKVNPYKNKKIKDPIDIPSKESEKTSPSITGDDFKKKTIKNEDFKSQDVKNGENIVVDDKVVSASNTSENNDIELEINTDIEEKLDKSTSTKKEIDKLDLMRID